MHSSIRPGSFAFRMFAPREAARAVIALSVVALLPAQSAMAASWPVSAAPPATATYDELPDAPQPQAGGMQIEILDGDTALNNVRQRTAREPIIQVTDANHKPIAGVAVLFTIVSTTGGAGGSFAGSTTLSVLTDAAGQAHAAGLVMNNVQGSFNINVSASHAGMHAQTVIHQQNFISSTQNSAHPNQNANSSTNSTTSSSSSSSGTTATTTAATTTAAHSTIGSTIGAHLGVVLGVAAAVVAGVVVTAIVITRSGSAATIGVGGGAVGHP